MNSTQLLINGQLIDGDLAMDVLNPATEEVIAVCARASLRQLNLAVAAAKAAFPAWSATPQARRGAALAKVAQCMKDNVTELAHLLTLESGKPTREAIGEVLLAASFFRHFSKVDSVVKLIENSDKRRVEAYRVPLGVVGAIVPWNFPLVLMAFKLPAALLTGNTVVLKPAPSTPLTTLRFGELVADLLPPGVLNIITDANELGALLTAHPDVRKISFTGSTQTGMRVMAGAAKTLKRMTLELGGNDAAFVLPDVDPATVAPKLFQSAFMNSGQMCVAIKRLYVHADIYDAVCEQLAALAEATVVGNGSDPATDMGPLQNKAQLTKVRELIEDARLHGGKIIAGGDLVGNGYFIRPTIIRDIQDGTRLVDEEQFGPVLPVIKYDDPLQAIVKANDSPFGLGGSIWTTDLDLARRLATHVEAGTVWINTHSQFAPHVPFGGMKHSGLGVELGEEAIAEFTQLKVLSFHPQ